MFSDMVYRMYQTEKYIMAGLQFEDEISCYSFINVCADRIINNMLKLIKDTIKKTNFFSFWGSANGGAVLGASFCGEIGAIIGFLFVIGLYLYMEKTKTNN